MPLCVWLIFDQSDAVINCKFGPEEIAFYVRSSSLDRPVDNIGFLLFHADMREYFDSQKNTTGRLETSLRLVFCPHAGRGLDKETSSALGASIRVQRGSSDGFVHATVRCAGGNNCGSSFRGGRDLKLPSSLICARYIRCPTAIGHTDIIRDLVLRLRW